jgi:hypothetical protein
MSQDSISSGVGLFFEGYPTDIKKFYWILTQEGCHPKATHRILNRINKNGFDKLTVMYRLNFKWIEDELSYIGIKMSLIPPQENWRDKYNDGLWSESDLPDRLKNRFVNLK